MDVLVDYIRYKCSALAGERNPAVLLAQCNQIVSSLYIIFDGDSEFVTLTLLKMDLLAGSGAVALMYPVFEQILASQTRRTGTSGGAAPLGIMDYVRLLLCYKKWKAMVPARRDKDAISALALKVLPPRCPQAKTKQDLPFVQMLPRLSASAKEQEDETRFLLAKDLMEIEQLCTIYFREYEKRFFQRNEPKLVSHPWPLTESFQFSQFSQFLSTGRREEGLQCTHIPLMYCCLPGYRAALMDGEKLHLFWEVSLSH
ncbi:hypothetical protein RP20_CCG016679 [Aedes albopictus]|nr:hypothetical protein RP20_CCG016679 [Aedes albopictus]